MILLSYIDLTTFLVKEQECFYIVSSSGTVSARKTVTNDTTLGVDKSECLMCDMWAVYLSQWELSAWPCSVTTLSSSSSSIRKGCRETGSSWGHEYLCRYGWDKAASAVSRSMGLKVRMHSRKSMPEMWIPWLKLLMYHCWCIKINILILPLSSTSDSSSLSDLLTSHPWPTKEGMTFSSSCLSSSLITGTVSKISCICSSSWAP